MQRMFDLMFDVIHLSLDAFCLVVKLLNNLTAALLHRLSSRAEFQVVDGLRAVAYRDMNRHTDMWKIWISCHVLSNTTITQ